MSGVAIRSIVVPSIMSLVVQFIEQRDLAGRGVAKPSVNHCKTEGTVFTFSFL